MKRPQVIVVESDDRLASQLTGPIGEKHWRLRATRRAERCMKFLVQDRPTVVVVRLGEPPGAELGWLSRVAGRLPGVRTVAIGGAANAAVVAGVVWDLDIDFALFPPLALDLLPEIVIGLMEVSEPIQQKRRELDV
jgi:DNA-binding NtrC family response regulator